MPRLTWDLHKLGEGHHTVSWGKSVFPGEQYFVPKHDGTSRLVILPLFTQYLPKSQVFVVGAQWCPGISKIDEQNALETKEAKGDKQLIGHKLRNFNCKFVLSSYNSGTGKHLNTRVLSYAADNAANAVPLGFYSHEPDESPSDHSNDVMVFYWHQSVNFRSTVCIPKEGAFFRTNAPDGLLVSTAYRRAFGDSEEQAKIDPLSTKKHFLTVNLPVCDQDNAEYLQGTTALTYYNKGPMMLVFEKTSYDRIFDFDPLPKSKNICMEVPFDPSVQLGRYFIARFTEREVKGLHSVDDQWIGRLVKPTRNFSRNTIVRTEKNQNGNNVFTYYFLFFEMLYDRKTGYPWQTCTVARADTAENQFRFHTTACLRCADGGLLFLADDMPTFAWTVCADDSPKDTPYDRGPSLLLRQLGRGGVEKEVVVATSLLEANAPPLSFAKHHFYNWIRDATVIVNSRRKDIHAFYVCDMYPTLEDLRFGPVAYSQLSYKVLHLGEQGYLELRHRPVVTEVFTPELSNFSAVLLDMENELFMLLYENAVDQVFNAFLFTGRNGGTIIEGADLMFPDAKPESYNSLAYGTRFEMGQNGVPYKIQLNRPTVADSLKDFGAPSLPDGNSSEYEYFQRLRATYFEGSCEGTWNPPLQHAPCTPDCFKFQTFRIRNGTPNAAGCPWEDGTIRAVQCASGGCSWVRFDVTDSFLRGSVDHGINTTGALFTAGNVAPVTFDFKTIADVSEVLLLFNGRLGEEEFDIEISFLNALGQEFSATSVRAGGHQLPVDLPFDRTYIRRCNHYEECAKKARHTRTGTVVKSPPLQVHGAKAVSIIYHGRTVGTELLEIIVKGREEKSDCPPHGFFTDPRKCPQDSGLLIPQRLADLDCQGFWTEWTTCDHFCRELRFFSRSRDPLPGGKPCPLMEHRPCDEGMYCRAADVKYQSVVDNLKERQCEVEVGEWSDCVNCRELQYTHVLMQAAKNGKACPEHLIETRFCNPRCEELFSAPPTATTTSATTSKGPTTATATRTSATSTPAAAKVNDYVILAIVAGNAALFVLVLCVSCCFLLSKSKQFRQSLEAKRKDFQLKKDVFRVRLEAAAAVQAAVQTAAEAKQALQPRAVSCAAPGQHTVVPSASLQPKRQRARQLASPRSKKTLFSSNRGSEADVVT
ncbi:transmembrane protein, partial [Cystoisospora suis]